MKNEQKQTHHICLALAILLCFIAIGFVSTSHGSINQFIQQHRDLTTTVVIILVLIILFLFGFIEL